MSDPIFRLVTPRFTLEISYRCITLLLGIAAAIYTGHAVAVCV